MENELVQRLKEAASRHSKKVDQKLLDSVSHKARQSAHIDSERFQVAVRLEKRDALNLSDLVSWVGGSGTAILVLATVEQIMNLLEKDGVVSLKGLERS